MDIRLKERSALSGYETLLQTRITGPVGAAWGAVPSLFTDPRSGRGLGRALPWLPLVLASAALNAFVEEATYRAAPLATLLPVVGTRQAIWLTAVWFGLGHYYGGIPSGPAGLLQSGLLAVLLGQTRVDTRGMGGSWTIHLALDSVIYLALAATS